MEWTATELPDWRPLEANVPLEERPDYMHMGVCGTIQLYKHRDTRRYLNIDADCVRFYLRRDGGFAEADREAAFLHVHGPAFSDGATNLPVQKTVAVRAAKILSSFFDFQRSAFSLGIGYRPYEAQAVITALGRVAYGLENLPGIIIRQASNEDLQRSFEHELRLLVEWIRTFELPQSWLQECVSCNRLHPHVGPLWRDFCTRIAAELGVEPSYGRPIAELASETRTALAPKKLRNRRAPFVGSLSRALGGWLRRFGRRRVP